MKFKKEDIWGLDYACSKWLLPRLKEFRRTMAGYPGDLDPCNQSPCICIIKDLGSIRWKEIVDEMIFAHQYVIDDDTCPKYNKHDAQRAQRGLNLFAKYYRHLWT